MKFDKKQLLLYVVTDHQWLMGRGLLETVESALKGGATFVQLREKHLREKEVRKEAEEIQDLCRRYHIPFVVNDNVDIAACIGADGVHVGQSDMEVREARKKMGADKIIGVSVCTVEQAILAERGGADYLGVGAMFPTCSKEDARAVSCDMLRAICDAVSIPVVAIGGITKENMWKLRGSGMDGVAVIRAIFERSDIEVATRELKGIAEQVVS